MPLWPPAEALILCASRTLTRRKPRMSASLHMPPHHQVSGFCTLV